MFNACVSIPFIKGITPFAPLMVMQNLYAGFVAGAGLVMVINIADGLSTYVFNGQTLSDKVSGALGLEKVTL